MLDCGSIAQRTACETQIRRMTGLQGLGLASRLKGFVADIAEGSESGELDEHDSSLLLTAQSRMPIEHPATTLGAERFIAFCSA